MPSNHSATGVLTSLQPAPTDATGEEGPLPAVTEGLCSQATAAPLGALGAQQSQLCPFPTGLSLLPERVG